MAVGLGNFDGATSELGLRWHQSVYGTHANCSWLLSTVPSCDAWTLEVLDFLNLNLKKCVWFWEVRPGGRYWLQHAKRALTGAFFPHASQFLKCFEFDDGKWFLRHREDTALETCWILSWEWFSRHRKDAPPRVSTPSPVPWWSHWDGQPPVLPNYWSVLKTISPVQEINHLSGNSMHVRAIAAAWLIALKAASKSLMCQTNTWNGSMKHHQACNMHKVNDFCAAIAKDIIKACNQYHFVFHAN